MNCKYYNDWLQIILWSEVKVIWRTLITIYGILATEQPHYQWSWGITQKYQKKKLDVE